MLCCGWPKVNNGNRLATIVRLSNAIKNEIILTKSLKFFVCESMKKTKITLWILYQLHNTYLLSSGNFENSELLYEYNGIDWAGIETASDIAERNIF